MSDTMRFKAQALDNISPDHYQYNGELLGEDSAWCGMITRKISEIAIDGIYLLKDESGAEIMHHGGFTLIQCDSEQRDVAGRRAPILCYDVIVFGEDPSHIVAGIVDFAKKIGRAVDQSQLQRIATKLKEKPRKSFLRSLFRTVSTKTRIG